jgi:hypothetical protein
MWRENFKAKSTLKLNYIFFMGFFASSWALEDQSAYDLFLCETSEKLLWDLKMFAAKNICIYTFNEL